VIGDRDIDVVAEVGFLLAMHAVGRLRIGGAAQPECAFVVFGACGDVCYGTQVVSRTSSVMILSS
jgi:hypothetical protein